jgi:glutamate 5-kinase
MSQPKRPKRGQRVVVKIGSRALAADPNLPRQIATEVAELSRRGHSFSIVSSGAIAIGCNKLGFRRRPREVRHLQAAAAVGQSELVNRYALALAEHGLVAAQVLLTHADLANRERVNNAREALAAISECGAIAIINENDTVSTEEIRFSDNDQLAAMVVPLVGADLLLLLTDVDGVLDGNRRRIPLLTDPSLMGDLPKAAGPGLGGMQSKVNAALKATRSGARVVIAQATRPKVITDVVARKDVGTSLAPHGSALRARKHWIAYTLRPRGTIVLDAGAALALRAGRSSLLPIGVIGLRGQFNVGDSVRLVDGFGAEIGRGLTRLGTTDLARAAGMKTADLEALFGQRAREVIVVHKDDLVLAI